MRPNTVGAYTPTPDFAYPGWRLTVPGGPAGGHYKGFTSNYTAGTRTPEIDQYEWDRVHGMASFDPDHANPANPRGVYRGPAEVPPAPNAGTSWYRTYGGQQTARHAGTSISPGSFPAPFEDTDEDYKAIALSGSKKHTELPSYTWRYGPGATNLVPMPPASDFSAPAPRARVRSLPAKVPRPAPTIGASWKDFLPANWGIDIVDGKTKIHAGQTGSGQPGSGRSGFADWMDQDTLLHGISNKWVLGGSLVGALLLFRSRR